MEVVYPDSVEGHLGGYLQCMTTHLHLSLDLLNRPDVLYIYPEGQTPITATAGDQVRRVSNLVTAHRTAAFIFEGGYAETDALAAVIPADIARELIEEGRLKWPLYTSQTVVKPHDRHSTTSSGS